MRFKKVRMGIYHTDNGLSVVHSEEDRCWYIIYRYVALHKCPTFADAKFICENYYNKTENAEQTLAVRRMESELRVLGKEIK